MDPIITQWNSEWVTGPGGVVFLMQEQNEALCVVHAPCRKMLEWLLAPDGVWLEGSLGSGVRQEYFPAEHVSLSSGGDLPSSYFALLCIDAKCRCEGRLFFFPALSRSRGADAALLFDTYQASLNGVCVYVVVCVCVCLLIFFLHQSSSVTLCSLDVGRWDAKWYWSPASWMFSESDRCALICGTSLI